MSGLVSNSGSESSESDEDVDKSARPPFFTANLKCLGSKQGYAVPGGKWAGDWGLVVDLAAASRGGGTRLKCLNCARGDCGHCKIVRGIIF